MEREKIEADDVPSKTAFRTTRLKSIISEIDIGEGKAPTDYVHRIERLSPSRAFPLTADSNELTTPKGKELTEEYRRLWDEFVKKWQENKVEDKWGYIARAVSILGNFTWCLPSDTTSNPDISLFDHLKTTSAIAVCIADEHADKEKPFLLVAVAFGGIQQYIFNIKKGVGGLARRLRSRSLFVAILSESVAFNILKRLNIPICNCILSAGGKFHLLLPNTDTTIKFFKETRAHLDEWAMRNFNGDIHLALAWATFTFKKKENGSEKFEEFDKIVAEVLHYLDEEKRRPFRSFLQNGDGWNDDKFFLPYPISSDEEGICAFCDKRGGRIKRIKNEDVYVCDNCGMDYDMGAQLPKERYIAFYSDGNGKRALPYGSFWLSDSLKGLGKPFLVVDMDGKAEGDENLPLYARRVCRHVPRDEDGNTMLFENITTYAQGRQALGYLKADVDNLGTIFAKGFEKSNHKVSISRVASLSRMLDLFFSAYLEDLLKNHFDKIYMVYSGGDDLLCLGPWNVVFDFAQKLREDFQSYTAGNPSCSLSAGIAMVNDSTPVLNAIEYANELLEKSKKVGGSGIFPVGYDVTPISTPTQKESLCGENRKDRLSAFGTSLPWKFVPSALNHAKKLLGWLQDKTLSTNQVRRLLLYGKVYQRYEVGKDSLNLQYIPLMAYDLRRNWDTQTAEKKKQKNGLIH